MEPAPEIVLLMERLFLSLASRDIDAVLDCVSREPGTLMIGYDPNEWWTGYDQFRAVFRVQNEEGPGTTFDVEDITAWKEGTVGWAIARFRTTVEGRTPLSERATAVWHQEGAYWRIVHWHVAIPATNEEALGVELTTAVEEILIKVQDHRPPINAMAPDGSVVIMFTDIEGSTALMEALGEERWLELVRWHNDVVVEQTAVFGGSVVKGQGDGFMLAFPASGSAAACAMGLQRALKDGWEGVPVPTRMGMHCGSAKAEAGDFFGRAVVIAARIAGAAVGGQILVSMEVQERLIGTFPLGAARPLSLKGIAGQHTAFPVLWE
jgi:adenylate cyclase